MTDADTLNEMLEDGIRTEEALARLRSRPDVAPADRLLRTMEPTDRQCERAVAELPDWAAGDVRELIRYTLEHYVGVLRVGKRAHVFVWEGLAYVGVYQAFEPWVAGHGPLREHADGLKESTLATYLGALMRAILGGRIVQDYRRPSAAGDDDALSLGLDEAGAVGDGEDAPARHLRIERCPVSTDHLRSRAVAACEEGALPLVTISPAEAVWLADEIDGLREEASS